MRVAVGYTIGYTEQSVYIVNTHALKVVLCLYYGSFVYQSFSSPLIRVRDKREPASTATKSTFCNELWAPWFNVNSNMHAK